ncbi:uncharacterized protein BT62DRAFT_903123 [Guyanagaster necrorhizus]|uniref:Uncharacterized protein n=1 Tax=Guyanagaster necrorhizus TaxID=856835 RepID=A0A9P7VLQ4_9AGAR|nr:uncharacterized protein BT62DRAFT_903123 [Guyanagaster necrorhizus MCA 3950]KAG7443491.1 hypothetical protein BT62DRAFT_903123 [Guyanagaster necrorhizus MCA 3950]
MKFTSLLLAVVSFFTVALAIPVNLDKRDVFVPPILYPHSGTVWTINERHNVTWDTSNAPVNITNSKGLIMLRKDNMATPLILAEGFNILLGRFEITVPWVVEGDDYSLVLFGDSGNWSENFTITGSDISF